MEERKIINNQIALDDLVGSCGRWGSIQCDGSGSIALYNILTFLGKSVTLEDIIDLERKSHSFLFGGLGGTNPFRVRAMLKKYGVRAHYAGTLRHINNITPPFKFIIYYRKTSYPYYYTWFQAGKLVRDKGNHIWIELYNPFHRYINVSQLKEFEKLHTIFLFTIEE